MSVKLVLWNYARKSDGRKAINIQIHSGSERIVVRTGFHARDDEWSEKDQNVKKKHPRYEDVHLALKSQRLEWEHKVLHNELGGNSKASALIRTRRGAAKDFVAYGLEQVRLEEAMGHHGNARTYEGVLRVFHQFVGHVSFKGLTYDVLSDFRDHKLKEGATESTVHNYLRTLRAIWNKAELEELPSPFKKRLFPRVQSRGPRSYGLVDVLSLWSYNPGPRFRQVRVALDFWKLGLLFRGMDIVDLALLPKGFDKRTHFTYYRQKTGSELTVMILPEAREILQRYTGTSHALPILDGPWSGDELRKFSNKRSNFNKSLKYVSKELELDTALSTKTCRYTFANLARSAGSDKGVISELLGHTTRSVTDRYLEPYDQETLDRQHEAALRPILVPRAGGE